MSRGINMAFLVGNLGKDPVFREIPKKDGSGVTKRCTFSIATNERYTDANNKTIDRVEWHNIVTWRTLAELCYNNLQKGDQVLVIGRIKSREIEDSSGQKRTITEISARTVLFLKFKNRRQIEEEPEE